MTLRSLLLISATAIAFAQPALAEDKAPAKPEVAPAAEAKSTPDYTVLTLNGQPIKNSEVEDMWKGLFAGAQAPDFNTFDESVRQNVLRGVISERLLYQEAQKAGVDKEADVQKRLENLKRQLVIQSFIEQKSKTLVSDEDLKKAYDAKVAELKGQEEVRARHILVKTEEEAKELSAQLKKGGDFEKIAKEKSIDKASAAQGGDLNYFTKERMVPSFSEAAFKLKKGETSAPVKSDFGWHIIQVTDRRPVNVPSFDEMKESLRAEAQGKATQAYVEGLLKTADVKYFDQQGKEKQLSRTFEAPKAPAAEAKPEGKPEAQPAR